jgi:hypothetical protein
LEKNEVYQYYKYIDYDTLTEAIIAADLENIKSCGVEALPLIKFLSMLYESVKWVGGSNTSLSNIGTKVNQINTYTLACADHWMFTNGSRNYDAQLHDGTYKIAQVDATLSSGSVTNQQLLDAITGKKNSILWIIISCDTVPGTMFNFLFHEEDGSAEQWAHVGPAFEHENEKIWLFWDCSTDNKKAEVDISGGSGSEKIRFTLAWLSGGF